MIESKPLSVSGRIAALFQSAQITPLLALVALLLPFFGPDAPRIAETALRARSVADAALALERLVPADIVSLEPGRQRPGA